MIALLKSSEKMLLEYAARKKMIMFPKMYDFVKERHADETRDSGAPYIVHVIDGCFVMMCFGIGSDVLFSAYAAHDVVENGKATLDEIEERSCHEVAVLVDFLDKTGMKIAVHFLQIALLIKAIFLKAIDRLSNMGDMFEVYPIEKQEHYLEENERYIFPMIRKALKKFSKYRLQLFVVFRILEIIDKSVRKSVKLYRELEDARKQLAIKSEENEKLQKEVELLKK